MAADTRQTEFRAPTSFKLRNFVRRQMRRVFQPKVVRKDRLIVADDADRCTNPVFLIGVHRSGTTLVRQIIDSHSRIACPAESFFIYGLAELFGNDLYQEGFEAMGFDREGIARGLRRTADFFFDAYRRSKDKPRWADKTPQYVQILDFIEEVFGPDCQYIVIYRHPLDIINSLLATRWDFSAPRWDFMRFHDDHFTNLSMYVGDGIQKQLDFEAAHPQRCRRLRYEQLVTEPEPVLRDVFEFLGEPWEEQVLAFYKQPHDRGRGHADAAFMKGFRPSLENWKGWTPEQIRLAGDIVAPQLEQLEYRVDV